MQLMCFYSFLFIKLKCFNKIVYSPFFFKPFYLGHIIWTISLNVLLIFLNRCNFVFQSKIGQGINTSKECFLFYCRYYVMSNLIFQLNTIFYYVKYFKKFESLYFEIPFSVIILKFE